MICKLREKSLFSCKWCSENAHGSTQLPFQADKLANLPVILATTVSPCRIGNFRWQSKSLLLRLVNAVKTNALCEIEPACFWRLNALSTALQLLCFWHHEGYCMCSVMRISFIFWIILLFPKVTLEYYTHLKSLEFLHWSVYSHHSPCERKLSVHDYYELNK